MSIFRLYTFGLSSWSTGTPEALHLPNSCVTTPGQLINLVSESTRRCAYLCTAVLFPTISKAPSPYIHGPIIFTNNLAGFHPSLSVTTDGYH